MRNKAVFPIRMGSFLETENEKSLQRGRFL
jgi:hypothetical protein